MLPLFLMTHKEKAMKKHSWFDNIWTFKILDKNGVVLFEDRGKNALADEGEEWVLRTAFRKDFSTNTLYVRLCNQVLAETTTLVDITTEPNTNGYAAQELERSSVGFPTIETVDSDKRIRSKTVTITASGGSIGPVSTVYLATTSDNTGKLIAYKSLPISQTILDGNSGTIYFQLKLS